MYTRVSRFALSFAAVVMGLAVRSRPGRPPAGRLLQRPGRLQPAPDRHYPENPRWRELLLRRQRRGPAAGHLYLPAGRQSRPARQQIQCKYDQLCSASSSAHLFRTQKDHWKKKDHWKWKKSAPGPVGSSGRERRCQLQGPVNRRPASRSWANPTRFSLARACGREAPSSACRATPAAFAIRPPAAAPAGPLPPGP